MDKAAYLKAVRKAERLFGYIAVADKRRVATRLSKARAALLVSRCDDGDIIDAMWASDAEEILLIG